MSVPPDPRSSSGHLQASSPVAGQEQRLVEKAFIPIDIEQPIGNFSFPEQLQKKAQNILSSFEIAKLMKKKL
jgi:hypothetical protein